MHGEMLKKEKIKTIFLHTICHNSDMFWTTVIIFRVLLNINKA